MRWSVERAGIEFGLTKRDLAHGGRQEVRPGYGWSILDPAGCLDALYGSLAVEKLATQKEARPKLELENAVTEARRPTRMTVTLKRGGDALFPAWPR